MSWPPSRVVRGAAESTRRPFPGGLGIFGPHERPTKCPLSLRKRKEVQAVLPSLRGCRGQEAPQSGRPHRRDRGGPRHRPRAGRGTRGRWVGRRRRSRDRGVVPLVGRSSSLAGRRGSRRHPLRILSSAIGSRQVGRPDVPCSTRWSTRDAMADGGETETAPPWAIAARGMPKTTQVSSFWAKV